MLLIYEILSLQHFCNAQEPKKVTCQPFVKWRLFQSNVIQYFA